MENSVNSSSAKTGTAGGTLLVLLINLFSATDILHTIMLSAIGAAVSFIVSYLLKSLIRKIKKKKQPE